MDYRTLLAKNARYGDGSYWIHPECRNYKLVFTGVNRIWLAYKGQLINRGVSVLRHAGDARKGVFANAKTLYGLTTFVDPIYTEFHALSKQEILGMLDFNDIVIWYLDDGCATIKRGKNVRGVSYRHLLCIGDFLTGIPDGERLFLLRMSQIFPGMLPGSICKNNSKATENNLVWNMPKAIGSHVAAECERLAIPGFEDKCRYVDYDQTSEIIPRGSRLPGFKAVEAGNPDNVGDDMIRTCQATGRDSPNPGLA